MAEDAPWLRDIAASIQRLIRYRIEANKGKIVSIFYLDEIKQELLRSAAKVDPPNPTNGVVN